MSMFGDLLNVETIRGIVIIFILIYFMTGKGFKVIGSIIRKQASNW